MEMPKEYQCSYVTNDSYYIEEECNKMLKNGFVFHKVIPILPDPIHINILFAKY